MSVHTLTLPSTLTPTHTLTLILPFTLSPTLTHTLTLILFHTHTHTPPTLPPPILQVSLTVSTVVTGSSEAKW